MTYEQGAQDKLALSTMAKKGTWNAVPLVYHADFYNTGKVETGPSGYFLFHEDVADPVLEIRNMIYNTFGPDANGGGNSFSKSDSEPFYNSMKLVLLGRYLMGTTYDVSDNETDKLLNEGIFVADSTDVKTKKDPKRWTNAIRRIHTEGDFDIGRLAYDDQGQCKAFLICGRCTDFRTVYFSEDGSAPLGQKEWQDETPSDADRNISLNAYLSRSKTIVLKAAKKSKKRKSPPSTTTTDTAGRKQTAITSFFSKN